MNIRLSFQNIKAYIIVMVIIIIRVVFPPHLMSVDQVKALVAGESFHVVPATNIRVDRKATNWS